MQEPPLLTPRDLYCININTSCVRVISTQEFPLLTPEYYRAAFGAGRLRVEDNRNQPLK